MILPLTLIAFGSFSPQVAAQSAVHPSGWTDDAAEAAELVERGKRELFAGKERTALGTFELAHEKSGGALVTESWLLRARIANGELDEAFERIVDLESSGAKAVELDYAIGVARYEFARRTETEGSGNPGSAYQEAAAYLADATAAAEGAFPDAWKMIAASSRWIGDVETASRAIDRALEIKRDGETLTLASKIRIARGAAYLGEGEKGKGRRALEQGVDDARAAVKKIGPRKKKAAQLADVQMQLAVGLLFLEKKADAASAYAGAIEWDPTQVDYAQLLNLFTDGDGTVGPFVDVLESGSAAYRKRWGKAADQDGVLTWWLGYGEFTLGRHADAVKTFEAALKKVPEYVNSYWYIGASNYHRGRSFDAAAAKAFRAYADEDPNGFASMVASSAENRALPGRVLGRLYGAGKLELAADLAEVRLVADDSDATLWNDVGLMSRDAGEKLQKKRSSKSDRRAKQYFERSWEAYERAIELDRKPYYLNDGAVILHYYLKRDSKKAIALYDEAEKMAEAMLAEGTLSSSEKDLVKIALRDARNNRAALKGRRGRGESAGR
ncbi:MAG: tetratricopeptide repeat protein [Planctomycetota bacterium]